MMTRLCIECGESFDATPRSRAQTCSPACRQSRIRKSARKYKEGNPVSRQYRKRKEYQLQSLYGISYDEYEDLLDKAGRKCQICGGLGQYLCVDHCHETGKVRGILCSSCNKALGTFGDNLEGLLKVVKYLEDSSN